MLDDLQTRWSEQESGSQFTPPGELEMRLTKFERIIRNRNRREYIAAAFGGVVLGWLSWTDFGNGQIALGIGWLVGLLGLVAVVFGLRKHATNRPNAPEQSCYTHLRTQLSHQRDVLRSVGTWYLGPLVPGWVIVAGARAFEAYGEGGMASAAWIAASHFVLIGGIFGFIWYLNQRASRELDRQVNELDEEFAV